MSENLSREDAGNGVCVLTLNRAPVNALNPDFLSEIDTALSQLGNDDAIKAIVLASNLKVFSAGMDLKEAMQFSKAEQTAVVDGLNATYTRLYSLPKPVITAANGAAMPLIAGAAAVAALILAASAWPLLTSQKR